MPNKIAVVTTTIRVPYVLKQYARDSVGWGIKFFVVGDNVSPDPEIRAFLSGLSADTVYLSPEDQYKYQCSEIIGWRSIQRRNIGILEAIKWGADIVTTIDDDNIPIPGYFCDINYALTPPLEVCLEVSSDSKYVNIGALNDTKFVHRGFPMELRHQDTYKINGATDVSVGVLAGLWLGDPDIDAVERIVKAPNLVNYSTLLGSGVVVAKRNFSPFNSQNTAFVGELAPLMMVLPGVGRYDDIWGSYIAQRIMWELGWQVMYGKPFVYQERNPQRLIFNLEKETYGMRNTLDFCTDLHDMELTASSVVGLLDEVSDHLSRKSHYIPQQTLDFLKAWVKDVEAVNG